MAKDHKRPGCYRYSSRVQNRFSHNTLAKTCSKDDSCWEEFTLSATRDNQTRRKGGYNPRTFHAHGVLQSSISSTKERRLIPPSHRLKSLGQIHSERTFPNGKLNVHKAPLKRKRIYCQTRPKRRLPNGGRPSRVTEVPSVSLARPNLPVSSLTVRAKHGTTNIYETAKACGSLSSRSKYQTSHLPGRHTNYRVVSTNTKGTHSAGNRATSKPRLYHQLREVAVDPYSSTRVPRVLDKLENNEILPTSDKGSQSARSVQISPEGESNLTTPSHSASGFPDQSIKELCELATRPTCCGDGRFSIDWRMKGYAFPPFNLIPRTLMKVINDNANIMLVAPVWQTQHWWPLLLQLTVQLLSSATRQSTNKSYDCAWTKWNSWCNRRKVNPISATVKDILTFLSDQFDNNLQYRTVNVLRSAISSIHPWIEGKPVGQHPLVIRLMKGIANERPPKPRYTTTWDVAKVTTYLSALGENKTLSLKLLTKKLLMLLALVSPERASVLWELNIRYLKKQPDGVVFTLIKPRKSGDPMSRAKATFPRFLQDTTLCPCDCLETYLKATEKFRLSEDSNKLFLSFQRPHHPVAKATVTRWLCDVLIAAGIDSTIFKAHSTRAASTSAAAKKHLPLDDILKMGDWTSPSTFQRFYYKPIIDDTYAKTVLTH